MGAVAANDRGATRVPSYAAGRVVQPRDAASSAQRVEGVPRVMAWVILRNWLILGVCMGSITGLQVYLATENLQRGLAMLGLGLGLGLVGGVARLVWERQRGGLAESEAVSFKKWDLRRLLVLIFVVALLMGAGAARAAEEPARRLCRARLVGGGHRGLRSRRP